MKGYSAFANKVWNAARFVLMNLKDEDGFSGPETIDELIYGNREEIPIEDRWLLHRLNQVSGEISEALDKFRFHEASAVIYQFIWHELCDWYIELVKPALTDPLVPAEERNPRVQVLLHALDYALRMLHPFMPFITEEIWQKIPHEGNSIMMQEFPAPRTVREDPAAAQKMQFLMDLTGEIRALRAEMNIDPRRFLNAKIVAKDADDRNLISENLQKIQLLARLQNVEFSDSVAGNLLRGVSKLGEFGLDVHDAINIESERDRLNKEMARVQIEIEKILQKINNQDFLSRAPEEIVLEIKNRHEEMLERFRKLESNLSHLPRP
jgi:valyl-tRNA synthetase